MISKNLSKKEALRNRIYNENKGLGKKFTADHLTIYYQNFNPIKLQNYKKMVQIMFQIEVL